jgi:hypothetical protein
MSDFYVDSFYSHYVKEQGARGRAETERDEAQKTAERYRECLEAAVRRYPDLLDDPQLFEQCPPPSRGSE